MKTRLKKIISLLLVLIMTTGLCACGAQTEEADADVEETGAAADTQAEETVEPTAEPEPIYSETALAEMAILDAVDYSDKNFLTEAEFYDLLGQILALHDVEMTRYPGDNAYFYYNYSNAQSVKFLTVAKTMEEIEADRAQAEAELQEAALELAKEKAAYEAGMSYTAPEKEEEPVEPLVFDAGKDVLNSEDYVVSFVISATKDSVDQELMFLTTSAVWAVLHPEYNNTDDAFAYLWRGLYTVYGNSGGLPASTIVGIDSSYSFRIPGNAVEAWMAEDANGNYVVAITLYAEYDDIIDLQSSGPEIFASMPADAQ